MQSLNTSLLSQLEVFYYRRLLTSVEMARMEDTNPGPGWATEEDSKKYDELEDKQSDLAVEVDDFCEQLNAFYDKHVRIFAEIAKFLTSAAALPVCLSIEHHMIYEADLRLRSFQLRYRTRTKKISLNHRDNERSGEDRNADTQDPGID